MLKIDKIEKGIDLSTRENTLPVMQHKNRGEREIMAHLGEYFVYSLQNITTFEILLWLFFCLSTDIGSGSSAESTADGVCGGERGGGGDGSGGDPVKQEPPIP